MKKCYFLLLSLPLNFIAIDFFGQTIWNGSAITFSKANGASPTSQSNQDRITANVWLTRGGTTGIYNVASESSYTGTSPANTEWAYGTLNNYATLTYSTWVGWHGKNPPSSINRDAVLHLISENIYIGIKFLSWTQSAGGGFSYQRTTAAVLPITLKSFSASLQKGHALLQWKTVSEINNHYFDIERSTNGSSFSSVGRINGSGTSSIEHTYTFTDNLLTAVDLYYRLAQHDFDGGIHYSSIIRVTQKTNSNLVITPNPAASFINIISSAPTNGSVYSINSVSGQTVKKGILVARKINVQELFPGQYWISIQDDKGSKIKASFIKK